MLLTVPGEAGSFKVIKVSIVITYFTTISAIPVLVGIFGIKNTVSPPVVYGKLVVQHITVCEYTEAIVFAIVIWGEGIGVYEITALLYI